MTNDIEVLFSATIQTGESVEEYRKKLMAGLNDKIKAISVTASPVREEDQSDDGFTITVTEDDSAWSRRWVDKWVDQCEKGTEGDQK